MVKAFSTQFKGAPALTQSSSMSFSGKGTPRPEGPADLKGVTGSLVQFSGHVSSMPAGTQSRPDLSAPGGDK